MTAAIAENAINSRMQATAVTPATSNSKDDSNSRIASKAEMHAKAEMQATAEMQAKANKSNNRTAKTVGTPVKAGRLAKVQ